VRRAFFLGLLAVSASCSPTADEPELPFQALFAVRGRWSGERELRLFVEDEPGPLARGELLAAVRAALQVWSKAGACTGALVETREAASVVLGWRRGAHGECVPFGADPSVAHAGPVGPGSFVHFDAGRAWREGELSLTHAAVHELGHVLGLDHGPDEESVMFPAPSATRRPLGRSDRAALRALYAVGTETWPGDLTVLRADGRPALVLPAVAPPQWTEFACFDTDGDGDDELLTWRVDDAREAGGALWSFHFAPGPVLERTLGPLYGVSAPGARLAFTRDAAGQRWLSADLGGAHARSLRFDAHGIPAELAEPAPQLEAPGARRSTGDLDGNGEQESVTLGP